MHGPRLAGPLPVSPGIGIGPKTSFLPGHPHFHLPCYPAPSSESERLFAALESARAELIFWQVEPPTPAGGPGNSMLDAHLVLLDDEELVGRALELIGQSGIEAEKAWESAVAEVSARFAALPDPFQAARADDVRAVGAQVRGQLAEARSGITLRPGGVLVADELTPSDVANLDPGQIAGIVTAFGTHLSHWAILARSLGIPAVGGAGEEVLNAPDGTTIVVDGSAGVVIVEPSVPVAHRYRRQASRQRHRAAQLLSRARQPAVTTDGVQIDIGATISSRDDAVRAVDFGADSIGVLRTELLFLDRPEPPSEDDQLATYLSIAEVLDGRRLTIRTLDAGGDKPMAYLGATREHNPFLGRRGLRLSLEYPEFFKQQLRAVIRTAMQYPVTVLFPMVTTIGELRSARAMLGQAAEEVGCPPGHMPPGWEVGAMVEVPAFALHAQAAVALVDVISIGSNDLTQYTLAAERGNSEVASLADPLDPAVLSLIEGVSRAAKGNARVSVCGEMTGDPDAAAILTGLGASELSMTAPAIPEVKQALRSLAVHEARRLAELALRQDSAAAVRALLR